MTQNLHNVQRLRLGSVDAIRKTRARLLRLMLAEEPSTIDLSFWRMILSQLNELRKDYETIDNQQISERVKKIELILQNLERDPIDERWKRLRDSNTETT